VDATGGLPRDLLVERGGELAEIDAALAATAVGEGSVVVLEGPAGIGKTALLGAADERAPAAGVVTFAGRAVELEGGFPYGVVRQLLEPTLRAARDDRRTSLLAGAAALAQGPLLGSPVAGSVEETFAVVHGLYWLTANLAAEAPLALLVDDVQWADEPSLRFLAYLARRVDGLAATVIVSARTGEGGVDPRLLADLGASARARVVRPAPLSDAGVQQVLARAFGRSPDPGFTHACRTVTGGIPFFVRELASALRLDGIEPGPESTAQVTAAGAPATIARVILAHLGRLSEGAVQLACAIAVLADGATLPRAAALAGLGARDAEDALDALLGADVVRAGPPLEFRHPIVRAAIYDDIAPGRRSGLHRQAAAVLRQDGAELDSVAGQLLRSEPVGAPETIATLREAAALALALALGAPESAARYLQRALREAPERELRTTVLLELGRAEQLSALPSAGERFAEAGRLAEDPGTRSRAMIEQAWPAVLAGDWQEVVTLLDGALRDLPAGEEPLRARAELMRATMASYDPRLVHEFVARLPTLEELVASGGPGTRGLALLLAAWRAQRDEPADRVLPLVARGWDGGRYLEQGEPLEYVPQGLAALMLCDAPGLAVETVEGLCAHALDHGSLMAHMLAGAHDAWIAAWRGDLAAAESEMRACIEPAIELGQQFAVLSILWYCGEVLLERPSAADLAAQVEAIELGPFAEVSAGALVIEIRGRLRARAGERSAAIADLRHAGSIFQALGVTNSPSFSAWRLELALMLGRDEREEALALVEAELEIARRSGQGRRIGVALRAWGVLDADPRSRLAHLEKAVDCLQATPARLEHARALVELGAARRRHGDRAASREPLREGLDLATRCGAERLAERARTELSATGARPRRALVSGRDALTPSELRVAGMAAEGRTSREIAQALFVTTKTIDAHLSHTYLKLGINSRRQLAGALDDGA
jgi:DNA-binding CsgD family transcriptional regulator